MALPDTLPTLDYTYRGLPHCFAPSHPNLYTFSLDVAYRGLPFVANDIPGSMIQTITITAPIASIETLSRKFPLVRDEMVYSSTEAAHSFPYVAVQKTAVIP